MKSSEIIEGIIPTGPLVTKTCARCQNNFERPDGLFYSMLSECPACREITEQERVVREQEKAAQNRSDEWNRMCPIAYRHTIPEKLPKPALLEEVLRWRFGKTGLALWGPTDSGKSRCAWQLLGREFLAGRSVGVLDSRSGLYFASLYSRSSEDVLEWVDGLIGNNVVLLDDVFKNKMTDSFEGTIFTIIDQRAQMERPIIVTCNDVGDSLASRMTPDRGTPLVRRIREFCTPIKF
jgi:DNA replication protein DnaC